MRIRKLASKVLGTPSSQQHSSPPPPPPATCSFGMMHAYACEVNRSPWDVFPFPPLDDDDDDPLPEEVEQQESAMADDGIKEEDQPMSAITSHSSSSTVVLKLTQKEPAATDHESEPIYEELYIECKPKKKKKANKRRKTTTTTNTTTILRAAATKQIEYIESTGYTCKKTDGKQWRCKMRVDQPNSLCHYHIDQLLSYRCSTNSTHKARRAAPARKTAASSCNRSCRKRPRTPAVATSGGSDSNDMYYYSAFGPWRGKQRGGEPATVTQAVKEESEEQLLECYISSRDNNDNQDNEDESDDDSLEEHSEEESKTEKLGSRKKKRRPVKARSLKSLL